MNYKIKNIIPTLLSLVCFAVIITFACKTDHQPVKYDKITPINEFEIEVGEPIVVAQDASANDLGWGYFQYPRLSNAGDGLICCQVAYKGDSLKSYTGEYKYYISSDKGLTWIPLEDSPIDFSTLMENGNYFQGVEFLDAGDNILMGSYEPQISLYGDHFQLYYLEDIEKKDYSKTFNSYEYNPQDKQINVFKSKFEWPYEPAIIQSEFQYPPGIQFFHFRMHSSNMIMKEPNGSLFAATYSEGFNSETGINDNGSHYNLYFFRSDDNARTWKYVSQIIAPADTSFDDDGYCEPCITAAQNGDYFSVFRSGNNAPCYYSVSHDCGETWTKPLLFEKNGVDPQIITLKCGVTIVSYGRPGIFIKSSNDPSLIEWTEPLRIGEVGEV